MIGILISFLVCMYFFVKNILEILNFLHNPTSFNFVPIFFATILLVFLVMHFGFYVLIMDEKQKVRKKIEDDGWETKWDRV